MLPDCDAAIVSLPDVQPDVSGYFCFEVFSLGYQVPPLNYSCNKMYELLFFGYYDDL